MAFFARRSGHAPHFAVIRFCRVYAANRGPRGCRELPANDPLNPPQFTFECLIDLTGFDPEPGKYYCLVESTGPAGLGPRLTGFGLYLGPSGIDARLGSFWQVWMGNQTVFQLVANALNPLTPEQMTLTYLALTFLGNGNRPNNQSYNLQLLLYFPNTSQDINSPTSVQAVLASFDDFQPNIIANGGGGDFVIGSGSNLFPFSSSVNNGFSGLGGSHGRPSQRAGPTANDSTGSSEELPGRADSG